MWDIIGVVTGAMMLMSRLGCFVNGPSLDDPKQVPS